MEIAFSVLQEPNVVLLMEVKSLTRLFVEPTESVSDAKSMPIAEPVLIANPTEPV